MSEEHFKVACPTCGRQVRYGRRESPHFPFCTERCKLVDLGKWLDGEHKISEPLSERPDRPEAQGEGDEAKG